MKHIINLERFGFFNKEEYKKGDYVKINNTSGISEDIKKFYDYNTGLILKIDNDRDIYKYRIYFNSKIPTFHNNYGHFKKSQILRLATTEEIEQYELEKIQNKYNL